MRPRAAISWSGGKDSCTALHRVAGTFDVVCAVTMLDEEGSRSRSHGLRPGVLRAQADRLGLALIAGRSSWETYTGEFSRMLRRAAALGVTHVVFGDIMFDANREWTERVCRAEGLTAVQPLWGEPTAAIACEFVESGAAARFVTVRPPLLDESWLGRVLTLDALGELVRLGCDPCGENGEYHTVVTACPLFSEPLELVDGERVLKSGCWAIDVAPR